VAVCSNCGKSIGFLRRLTGGGLCPDCEKQKRDERDRARSDYQGALNRLASGELQPAQAASLLEAAGPRADLSESERASLKAGAFRGYTDTILADDILSEDEEQTFEQTADALGIDQDAMGAQFRDVMDRLVIARVNDGRLPEVEPSFMTKRSEVVHAEVPASLLKEVTIRERHGGYRYGGFSFRVAKGVRFNTGQAFPPRTAMRQEIQQEDTGILAITSLRCMFIGQGGTTVEMPYTKLVNLGLFSDAIQFHLSNRKRAPLFALGSNIEPVAAVINAAAQHSQD
jgi:hypothetical protein